MTADILDMIPASAIEQVHGYDVTVGDVLLDSRVPGKIAAVVCGVKLSDAGYLFDVMGYSEDGDIDDDFLLGRATTVGRLRNASAIYNRERHGYEVKFRASKWFARMHSASQVIERMAEHAYSVSRARRSMA